MAELRVLDAEPAGKGIADLLEKYAALARDGELSSIAIAAVKRDGAPNWDWSNSPNASTLLGVVERLKAAMIRTADASD